MHHLLGLAGGTEAVGCTTLEIQNWSVRIEDTVLEVLLESGTFVEDS